MEGDVGLSVYAFQPSPKRRVSRGTIDNCQQRISSHLRQPYLFQTSTQQDPCKKINQYTSKFNGKYHNILYNISLNQLPHKVKIFVRNCDTTKHQYNQCTLICSSDCLLGYGGTPANNWNLGNLDFFIELTATPEEWKDWLASKQKLLDELIADKDYDPLNALERRLVSSLRKGLSADDDYESFNASPKRLPHESRKRQLESPLGYDDYGRQQKTEP